MIHRAGAGRFLIAGPAIALPMLYKDMFAAARPYLRDTGRDAAGLTRWTVNGTVTAFDDIAPLLINQHELDHVELFGGTPAGVLLAKLHQFQAGRLHYLLTKLASEFGSQTLSVRPPFIDWFKEFADRQPEARRIWEESIGIIAELFAYQQAEQALLTSRLEDPELAVGALEAALEFVARFQVVPQPRPTIRIGHERLLREVARWKLSGEAVFEAHSLLRELLILGLTRAPPDVHDDWHATRLWSPGSPPTPLNSGVHVLDLFEMSAQQGAPRFGIEEQRLLLDLALLAPLDPATWAPDELPLDAVHPALRLVRLLEHCMKEGRIAVDGLTASDVDDVFEQLGWPTLTEIARRSRDQEPIGISHEESAAQYANLGARAGPYDPLRTTRDTLRTALQMRSDDPCVFAQLKQRFPMPTPMQYYTDEVWLRDGYTWDTEARHERVVITLLGLWLLHGRPSDFKMAAHVNNSMRGFLRRSKRARPDDPDVAAVPLETLLRSNFHAEPPAPRELWRAEPRAGG